MSNTKHKADFESPSVRQLREDLALALRAAAFHGLSEGVCAITLALRFPIKVAVSC